MRQGNRNKKVFIYRYITQGSFDAYSWQLLETKQRFITGLLSGSMTERSGTDIEDTVLNYAEVKALAVGNPMVKERVEAANELAKYMTLQRKLVDSRLRMEKELGQLPGQIEHQRDVILKCERDLAFCTSQKQQEAAQEELLKKARETVAAQKALQKKTREAAQQDLLKIAQRSAQADLTEKTGEALQEQPQNNVEEAPQYKAEEAAQEELLEKAEEAVQEILQKKDEAAARRRQLRERIGSALGEHLLAPEELQLLCYRGFEVILPANMTKERPYLWLAREGKYHVGLSNTEAWSLIRIDHVLDNLNEWLEKLKQEWVRMKTREAELKSALAKEESYADKIEKYRKKVESLDKKLGVDEK